jgi:hypothetical protein
MKNVEKRKGIWIPVELMENIDLDWTNKVLLSEICSLNDLPDGCFASNEYFGGLLRIAKGSASKRITQLTNLGYIKTENVYQKGNCIGRVIVPTGKKGNDVNGKKVPVSQKGSSSENHEVVPERQGGSSSENQGVVPERPEGSSSTTSWVVPEQQGGGSQTIRGVVLERLGGGSPENPINTIINTDILKELEKEKTLKQALEHSTGENPEISISNALPKKEISELHKMRDAMNEWFDDYPNWESDLLRLGLDKFIWKTAKKYKTNDKESFDIIKYFLSL